MNGIFRIITHHTGGGFVANATDLAAYHDLIQGDGSVVAGKFPISANAGKIIGNNYSKHTAGLNSGAISATICAMKGGIWSDPFSCPYFPTLTQADALVDQVARRCIEYGIDVTREEVLSHGEVQITLKVKQKQKWDYDYCIWRTTKSRDPIYLGDAFRERVKDAIMRLRSSIITPPKPSLIRTTQMPLTRRGATGMHVRALQSALGLKIDGIFGPKTEDAVRAFQKKSQLIPDGIVGRMTWTALQL